jgi:hypothetical protein
MRHGVPESLEGQTSAHSVKQGELIGTTETTDLALRSSNLADRTNVEWARYSGPVRLSRSRTGALVLGRPALLNHALAFDETTNTAYKVYGEEMEMPDDAATLRCQGQERSRFESFGDHIERQGY